MIAHGDLPQPRGYMSCSGAASSFVLCESIRILTWAWLVVCIVLWLIVLPACTSQTNDAFSSDSAKPDRIVSLSPNVTEILFELGAGNRVVAVTRFCDHPNSARALPKIGGFIDPSFEAIVGQRPSLVIGINNTSAETIAARLSNVGIPARLFPMETLSDTRAAIASIAALIGSTERGRQMISELDTGLTEVADRIQKRPRRRVVVLLGYRPMVVAGPHTFIDELVSLAGGINVARGAQVAYPMWSPEAVAASLPDVIVDTSMGSESMTEAESLRHWEQWSHIPAVQRKQIVHLPDASLLRPGPRLVQGLRALAETIHPEAFEGDAKPANTNSVRGN